MLSNNFDTFSVALQERIRLECAKLLDPHGLSEFADLLAGGRLLRSRLAYEVAATHDEDLLEMCVAMELLHVSTLVHDDIIDHAARRRGFPTVSAVRGDETALLVGNMLVGDAIQVANRYPGLVSELLSAYGRVNVAQLEELAFRGRIDRSIGEYLRVCRGKTSSMFELAAYVGVSCGEPDEVIHLDTSVRKSMESFGIAFQLSDDIEDVQEYLDFAGRKLSKDAKFDIEVGNFTAPTLLASVVGTSESDIRRIDIDHISRPDWNAGIAEAIDMRDEYIRDSLRSLRSAASAPGRASGAGDRLLPWLQNLSIRLRATGIDRSIRS